MPSLDHKSIDEQEVPFDHSFANREAGTSPRSPKYRDADQSVPDYCPHIAMHGVAIAYTTSVAQVLAPLQEIKNFTAAVVID